MAFNLNTSAPLSFGEWQQKYPRFATDDGQVGYNVYLKAWYQHHPTIEQASRDQLKSQYIQLLQDLSYLFSKEETDLFLTDIDWTNKEDLILVVPLYARKLKEISQVLANKREHLKQAKQKYNLKSTELGLESLVYQFILNGFTKKDYSLTQVPCASFRDNLPDLSAISADFRVDLEELYDRHIYQDSDPSAGISSYDIDWTAENLTAPEIAAILETRFLDRLSDNPISAAYHSLSGSAVYQIQATNKFSGATIYSVSSQYVPNQPDRINQISLSVGNNWFLWPSGVEDISPSQFTDVYKSIPLSASNLVSSGATGGSDLTNSDLIFTEKNGKIEGAWLSQQYTTESFGSMQVEFPANQTKEFRYPYPGFLLTNVGFNWSSHSLTEQILPIFHLLDPAQQTQLLQSYWTEALPTSAVAPLFINETSLVELGAWSAPNALSSDVWVQRQTISPLSASYSDAVSSTDHAFLYKFQYTDLGVVAGDNYILWPVAPYIQDQIFPLAVTSAWCNPAALRNFWTPNNMTGAVAGLEFASADQIYKLNGVTEQAMEAAWLYGGSVTDLYSDPTLEIDVYDKVASSCAVWQDGPIQPSLSLEVPAGDIQSFVWMDQDTPANQVFAPKSHKEGCEYIRHAHNYYQRQGATNLLNPTEDQPWTLCKCKALQYSPVGHEGSIVTDYNGTADYLFEDPQGLGKKFALNTWQDTRNLTPVNSPQFAFFHLLSGQDQQIGWGPGTWKTGTGQEMVLKTGRRYSYYRSSIRRNASETPYYVLFYPYVNIRTKCSSGADIVLLLDFSSSEAAVISTIKTVASQLMKALLSEHQIDTQISLMVFDDTVRTVFNFIRQTEYVDLLLNEITPRSSTQSDYIIPLQPALSALYNIPPDALSAANVCSQLPLVINDRAGLTDSQVARPYVSKKIIILGDGADTINATSNILSAWKNVPSDLEIFTLNIGPESIDNNLLESIAKPAGKYLDLQQILLGKEVNIATYCQFIHQSISNCPAGFPVWKKAIRQDGEWVGTMDNSDLVFQPGDHLQFVHQSSVSYTSPNQTQSFQQTAPAFKIKYKLNGWDYTSASFSNRNIGTSFGCRPFWGTAYNSPSALHNFDKDIAYFGGHVRFFHDYIPIVQPEISTLLLKNDSYIQYIRRANTALSWAQSGIFQVSQNNLGWLKLEIDTRVTNLSSLFLNNPLDKISIRTDEPSNIQLESYHLYQPAKYNYWAKQPLVYSENLYLINSCISNIPNITSVYVEPTNPWNHLENIHYPTIASVSQNKNLKTKNQLGYLYPPNIGCSTFMGKGYTMTLNLSALPSWNQEPLYWDLNLYGPRNRGLSKKDQKAPVVIHQIDNRWIMNPYYDGKMAGVCHNPQKFQKMVPYQSDWETNQFSSYGVSRPEDYETFRQLISDRPETDFNTTADSLLANAGTNVCWTQDWFGREYYIFK